MAIIFGVDSTTPANKRLTNGYRLYDWVMRQNSFPAFWGRALTGEDRIEEEELAFLREKNCKVALILRDLTEAGVSASDGMEDGLRAVEAAKALGVPDHAGVALFAEIRPEWSVSHNWMLTFAETLVAAGYVPGFIGNTDSSKNFNFDRQCSHYVQATDSVDELRPVYWGTEPKVEGEPEEWAPYCPSALTPEEMDLWQSGVIRYGDITANEDYIRQESPLERMW